MVVEFVQVRVVFLVLAVVLFETFGEGDDGRSFLVPFEKLADVGRVEFLDCLVNGGFQLVHQGEESGGEVERATATCRTTAPADEFIE